MQHNCVTSVTWDGWVCMFLWSVSNPDTTLFCDSSVYHELTLYGRAAVTFCSMGLRVNNDRIINWKHRDSILLDEVHTKMIKKRTSPVSTYSYTIWETIVKDRMNPGWMH